MRYTLSILGLAILITGALSLVRNSSHGLGTGANSWDVKSFGWPVEVWSRTVHTYRTVDYSDGKREVKEVRYPTKYSVRWLQAGLLFAGALAVSYIFVLCVFPQKDE